MTPARLTEIMHAKGWTSRHLAKLICCNEDIVGYWRRGYRFSDRAPIAPVVATWLEAVAAGEDQPPPAPETWKRHRGGGRA